MVDDEHSLALVVENRRGTSLSGGPPAGIGGHRHRFRRPFRFDDQIELRHWAQTKPGIPAEECGHAAHEQRVDVGTLAEERKQQREPVEQQLVAIPHAPIGPEEARQLGIFGREVAQPFIEQRQQAEASGLERRHLERLQRLPARRRLLGRSD